MLNVKLNKYTYGCLKMRCHLTKIYHQTKKERIHHNLIRPMFGKKMVNGKQMKIKWHADDLKISHSKISEATRIITWLELQYGKMCIPRGKAHDYLDMDLK